MSWIKLKSTDPAKALEELTEENVNLRRRLVEEEVKYKILFCQSADAVRDLYAYIRDLRRKLGLPPYGDDIP